MIVDRSAPIQHRVRKRPEWTGNNRHIAAASRVRRPAPHTIYSGGPIARQIVTDQQKRMPGRYFSNCRAMTMRWIWLVPS
jgi:hypothetical protein